MLALYHLIILLMANFLIAGFLILYLPDRYFGTSIFGGRVKKKRTSFLERQPLWINNLLSYLVVTTIVSIAGLWPAFLLGNKWLEPALPFLYAIWIPMALISLITVWGRGEKSEMDR